MASIVPGLSEKSMQNLIDRELRQVALTEAAKAYTHSSMTAVGGSGGGSLPADQVVARAEAYYNFLKGETK